MKRIDRLIFGEMVGPWLFGVAMFTALVFTSVLLVRITEWVTRGISPGTIFHVILLLLPGIAVKTLAMALLLAALLSFGRLSNDSEITALRAAGASLTRILRPVLLFSVAVALLTFCINEFVVPEASYRAQTLTVEIKKELDGGKRERSVFYAVPGENGATALIMARDFNTVEQTLKDVVISVLGPEGRTTYILIADELAYTGPQDWRISGSARLIDADGSQVTTVHGGAWPKVIEPPKFTPRNLLAGFADDLDAFSLSQILEEIRVMRADPYADKRKLANLEFGMYNKFALPLGSVIFALLGAPLGIRNQRSGVGTGFAISIGLSFGYLIVVNWLAVYAKSGAISPFVASFFPLFVGIVAVGAAMAKKNV